ncbi:hypothetical protein LEP1GSC127_4095 [Leptospira kirschneri str. 200801925]|uniref:Uncharacterized protein n=1 Tax=Leptospira kirschneri str. 200802841 TaxID=1193047 RepID=A0A828Y855_9LEPT|nr:hypothetical protein LEP1GSC131_0836 [Leptospira kirschneri str. 200802841]EMO75058.1 hypothetical protein LEP1GSC127_4095 [Leptospira kirschneri str. 200801925]
MIFSHRLKANPFQSTSYLNKGRNKLKIETTFESTGFNPLPS